MTGTSIAQPADRRKTRFRLSLLVVLCFFSSAPERGAGYSFLTHEQLIDLAWEPSIRPLLLARFPGATPAQLKEAHAFAYGGCAIQDLGYYPFGQKFFSDLTHYVRSGEFIDNLFRNARNIDEYAFAIGALSHYVGDNIGHQDAINRSTAVNFPKLERKYGPVVTYDENPYAHVRTEFAFDIDQLSYRRFAPAAYLRFIGLKVPNRLLERAFFATYGLPLRQVLGRKPVVRGYRFAVRSFLPRVAYAEAVIHRKSFPDDTPGPAFETFKARLAQADFQNGWNQYRLTKPRLGTRLLAFVIRILPKVGPFSQLAIRGPDSLTESWYVASVNRATDTYEALLGRLKNDPQSSLTLPNRDLDTGYKVQPGGYALTDQTYAKLLEEITADPNRRVPRGLYQDILDYYADPDAPITTKKNARAWERVQQELAALRQMKLVG